MNTGSLISPAFLYGSERSESNRDPPPEPGFARREAHNKKNAERSEREAGSVHA
jgi:hypothetical protein